MKFLIKWVKNIIREYKYRKKLKQAKKDDPFIY